MYIETAQNLYYDSSNYEISKLARIAGPSKPIWSTGEIIKKSDTGPSESSESSTSSKPSSMLFSWSMIII